jgi:hypothetical protein
MNNQDKYQYNPNISDLNQGNNNEIPNMTQQPNIMQLQNEPQNNTFEKSLDTGPRGGTSISNMISGIKNQQPPLPQYQQQPPPQYQQPPPPQYQQNPLQYQQNPKQYQQNPKQYQQNPKQYQHKINNDYSDIESEYSKHSNQSKNSLNNKKHQISRIKNLADNLNKSLKNKRYLTSEYSEPSETESDKESVQILKSGELNISKSQDIREYIKEMMLIIIVYTILSQDFLKRTISIYIPQITTNTTSSYLIYGIIHAILFIILKIILRF